MCRQVSRLGFLLLGRLPIPLWGTVAFCPFVRFTVTGIAQKSHLHSHGVAQSNTGAVLRTNTRYSFQNTQAPLSGGMITPFDWQIALLLWYSGVAAPEGLPAVATAMPERAPIVGLLPNPFRRSATSRPIGPPLRFAKASSLPAPNPPGTKSAPVTGFAAAARPAAAGGRPRRRGRRFAREPV